HRHLCFLQLFQVARDLVYLFHPLFVQGSPPSQHVAKLVFSETTLHAGELGGVRPWQGLKRYGLLGRRRYRVPAKGDDRSQFVLSYRLFYNGGTRQVGVLVAILGKAEILAPNGGCFANIIGSKLRVPVAGNGKVMLTRQNVFTADVLKILQQRDRLRRGVWRDRLCSW